MLLALFQLIIIFFKLVKNSIYKQYKFRKLDIKKGQQAILILETFALRGVASNIRQYKTILKIRK